MSAPRRVAVVVDAYSTGSRLAPRFIAEGLDVVHVQSNPNESPFYIDRLRTQDFLENVVHHGDLAATAAAVARYDPAFVVVGSEPGVLLNDALSERLGLPSNGTAQSAARRDKSVMAAAVRAAGLRAVQELKTGDVEEAIAWAAAREDWPVVVKPLDSAGTDGVALCEDADAIRAAFAAVLGRPNALQGANEQLLVQELLKGTQLFCDSVSWDGVHHVSEVWRDTKIRIEGNLAYDFEELLDYRGEQQDQVVAYVKQVLDALGIRYGPAHTEVMLTKDGPVLVESGARLHGSIRDDVIDRCTPSHVTVTVDAYLRPETVAARADRAGGEYELANASRCVMLISHQRGRVVSDAGMRAVEALPSYAGSISMAQPGEEITPTIDLFSCPGIVYLVDPDRDVLKRDYDRLREIEREQGIFEVETPEPAAERG
jgi:ATP-grasp domain